MEEVKKIGSENLLLLVSLGLGSFQEAAGLSSNQESGHISDFLRKIKADLGIVELPNVIPFLKGAKDEIEKLGEEDYSKLRTLVGNELPSIERAKIDKLITISVRSAISQIKSVVDVEKLAESGFFFEPSPDSGLPFTEEGITDVEFEGDEVAHQDLPKDEPNETLKEEVDQYTEQVVED